MRQLSLGPKRGAYFQRISLGFDKMSATGSFTPGKSGSRGRKSLNLYLMGLIVNCPSGSTPVHLMRTEGVTIGVTFALGRGWSMLTCGAIVKELKVRHTGAEIAPWLST